jgi:hypothetical protein
VAFQIRDRLRRPSAAGGGRNASRVEREGVEASPLRLPKLRISKLSSVARVKSCKENQRKPGAERFEFFLPEVLHVLRFSCGQ